MLVIVHNTYFTQHMVSLESQLVVSGVKMQVGKVLIKSSTYRVYCHVVVVEDDK